MYSSSEDDDDLKDDWFYSTPGDIVTLGKIDYFEKSLWRTNLKSLSMNNLNVNQPCLKSFFSSKKLQNRSLSIDSFTSSLEKYKRIFFAPHPHNVALKKSLDDMSNSTNNKYCNCVTITRKKQKITKTNSHLSLLDKNWQKDPLEISLLIDNCCSLCWNVTYMTCDHMVKEMLFKCRICTLNISLTK